MENGALKNIFARVVYLVACTLSDKCPDTELLKDTDVGTVYLAARKHNMGALVSAALEKVGLATDEMRADGHRATRKIMLLDAERGEIVKELERLGIRYLPLKGVVIKELYPRIGLREMSDNDILFDEEYRDTVRDIFKKRGYSIKSYGKDKNHDSYLKDPVYNYEMHVSLFRPLALGDELIAYFDRAMDRAIPDGHSTYGLRMTDEDFYIYMKAHEYKHYVHSGIGLRLFADAFLYLREYGDRLDFQYINNTCEEIGIADFERLTAALSAKIMDVDTAAAICRGEEGILTEEERELFSYCSYSGSYGLLTQDVENGIKRIENKGGSRFHAKCKYVLHRLFPPSTWYRAYFPFAYKHAWARPFALIWRFFKVLFVSPKRIIVPFLTVLRYKGKNKKDK